MSDLLSLLASAYTSEEIEAEIRFVRNCGFVREPENKGIPMESLHEALGSLAEDYKRVSR